MTTSLPTLKNIATQLRIDSVVSTSEAGSGHPTSCLSAAEIVATLFFSEMHYDPKDPQNADNDRFVLSKGHAAPILYAAWAEAGLFPREELLKLRRIGSEYRTYVLLGDGEMAEGSVWEAANVAVYQKLDNLCCTIDVNRLGQSQPTQFGHDVERIAARWRAFDWHTIVVDGHDIPALLTAYDEARATKGRPTVIVAKTVKGKGLEAVGDKNNWHGKALKKGDEADKAIAELQKQMIDGAPTPSIPGPRSKSRGEAAADYSKVPAPAYKKGDSVATREAWGVALAAAGAADPRIVALDADVKNSTFSDKFEKIPGGKERFFENFIAEQVMVGAAMGLAARGAIPFPSTFACFLTRAADFVRMGAISFANVKFTGSHAGVSIGEDGPSQMALEDLSMMRAVHGCAVLYPSDAVSTERLVVEMARHKGMAYMRTSRPKTPVIYGPEESFPIGGSKVIRQSNSDVAAVIGAGVTLFEALKAHDQLKSDGINIRVIDAYSVEPIDAKTMIEAGKATGGALVTVEDHFPSGGIGDAVSEAVAPAGFTVTRLAVREIPRSGQPDELLDRYGISARRIVDAVQQIAASRTPQGARRS